ncbi:hypothetical protein PY650_17285, partial [Rhizobium calliandrae]
SSKLKCEKVRLKPWLPKSRQLSAFVAVRDRMYRGYTHMSDKIDYGTIGNMEAAAFSLAMPLPCFAFSNRFGYLSSALR